MKPTRVGLLVLLVVVATGIGVPRRAWSSGSSVVEAKGALFVAQIESVRKIFAHNPNRPNVEGDWHRSWREQNQPVVDKIGAQLKAELGKVDAKAAYRLAPYDEKVAEVREDDLSDEPPKGPFRCTYRLEDVLISVTHSQPPSKTQRTALRALFARAIKAARG